MHKSKDAACVFVCASKFYLMAIPSSYKQLTDVERYQIYAFLKAGYTQKKITYELNRSPLTICREVRRNKGLRGYRPQQAQRLAEERKRHPIHGRIVESNWLKVEELLRLDWSPEQVSEWLKRHERRPSARSGSINT